MMFFSVLLEFHWMQLLQPQWYIENAGLWFILFVIFAETGLFAGFFLPGDSLLFVAGIYSDDLVNNALPFQSGNTIINLLILGTLIALAGIVGNTVGYWFGRKSGPFLFERNDSMLFKKKYLYQAKDFYDKHGAGAIVLGRFLPIVRTFAPIVAGMVKMDSKKFAFYNIVGSFIWVFVMIVAGHYLQRFILDSFDFDLKKHLEVIVVGIVLITTLPVLLKMIFGKSKSV
jgi:membrane-associated protein